MPGAHTLGPRAGTGVTLMFEMTSLGAVLPSYDMETRVEDTGRLTTMKLFMNIAMGLCMFFVLLEGIEISEQD